MPSLKDPHLAVNGGSPVRTRPFHPWPVFGEREEKALLEVLHSGQWWFGARAAEFAAKFAAYQHAKYAVCVSSGTTALEVAFRALDLEPGDEVIVPDYTFIATASAPLFAGLGVVLVDIDPETYLIDLAKAEAAIGPRTQAIAPVHLAGCPVDMDKVNALAQRHGLFIIEDCAQAHGAEWNGKRVGALGSAGIFSFQASKNLNSGEGGIILTNDSDLYERCWALHNCGRRPEGAWYQHFTLGGNYRITEWQAALLLAQFENLEEQIAARTRNAAYLDSLITQIPGVRIMRRPEGVTRHAYHLYMFRYDAGGFGGLPRDEFLRAMNAEGIPVGSGYTPLHDQLALDATRQAKAGLVRLAGDGFPATLKACNSEGVWLGQNVLLGDKRDMEDIAEAAVKIRAAIK